MRSRSRDEGERSGTLVGRVAMVAALAAVVGGLLAAVAAVVLAEAVIVGAEDRRLREEATEIVMEVQAIEGDVVAQAIEKERRELLAVGLRVAVFREGAWVGGDASIPRRVEGCWTARGSQEQRVCAVSSGPWVCVVAVDDAPHLGGWTTAGIVLGAVVVAAGMGALASRRLAGWAVAPLSRLGERLGDAPMDKAVDLGTDEGVREIDALRRTLRALLDRRAEALRAARLFAAGAAHELRTPLTTLSGELELLAEEPLPAGALGRIEGLRGSTAHIGELVERLLVLARVGGAEAMRHDAVELGEVLDGLRGRLSAEFGARLSCELRVVGMVRGDESLLTVLCENVVGNALVHARPGAVRVVLDERGGEVVLDVIDEGPGVSPGERARLFEPFQRGASGGAGAGLGLSLVAQIARAHGGEVAFLDAARGAHLRVRLPRWAPREAPVG